MRYAFMTPPKIKRFRKGKATPENWKMNIRKYFWQKIHKSKRSKGEGKKY